MMIFDARKRTLPALAAIAAAMILAGAAAFGVTKPAWTKFNSKDERFSVLMPETPKTIEQHKSSFVGDVTTFVHTAKDGRDTYIVDYTTLPKIAVSFAGRDGIYDHAKSAVLGNTYSKEISFTDITLDGVQGKKLVYDCPSKPDHPEMQGEARFFLFDLHLYTADAVVVMQGADEKLQRFFSSLEIEK